MILTLSMSKSARWFYQLITDHHDWINRSAIFDVQGHDPL